jgi:hypothetical protein
MNDKLKKTLKHYIDLDGYANTVDDDLIILYEELGKEAEGIIGSQTGYGTKDAYALVMRMLREKITSFCEQLEERLNTEADNVKVKELSFLKTLYPALAISEIATSKVLFAPIDNRDTVSQFVERTKKNIIRSYDNALRSGYLFGQSSQDVNKMAENNLKQVERGIESGIKTAVPSFAKTTDRIVFLQNKKEVVWCSCLDGSECIVCGSLHGTKYPSVSMAPMTPHFGCRCILMPNEEITEPMPTYEEYIEGLTEKEQYEILGKNRYELWKKDGISLRKFINNGRKLRLDEIDLSSD